jgi:hypothetical protein
MKKLMVFVFAGLMMLFVSGSLFAGRMFQRSSTTQSRGPASAAEIAEVPEQEFYPRQNKAAIQAGGRVYALPATPLKPEAERLPPPVYAISGVRGAEIREGEGDDKEAVDVVVALPERETFSRGILEGEDVSSWIENLPAGLEARAHGVKRGATVIKMYVSGTPTVTGRDIIRVTIPGTYLAGGSARQFVSPTQEASQKAWEDSQTSPTGQTN